MLNLRHEAIPLIIRYPIFFTFLYAQKPFSADNKEYIIELMEDLPDSVELAISILVGTNRFISSLSFETENQKGAVVLSNLSPSHKSSGKISGSSIQLLKNILK